MSDAFRTIPSIEQLRQREAMRALEDLYGREALVDALRAEADDIRQTVVAGAVPGDVIDRIERGAASRLAREGEPSLRRVINATGVVIHTNLGRAPLAKSALQRVAALAGDYTNLEYDLGSGARGHRHVHAEQLLTRLTGAAAAVVVNNNAAATLLALAALANGREVIISRGELVEIGGGFRVPDVMAQSGAILREVGTTNRTRAADYAAAISEKTGMILRVHPSNFRVEGFTSRPDLGSLVELGRRFTVPVVEDLGSGYVGVPPGTEALRDEPDVRDSLRTGADLVMFSGDKLLGGPQAGILAGTVDVISAIRRHPLMRALRVDKMTYAALEATLAEYAAGRAIDTIPVPRMIAAGVDEIGRRADAVAARLRAAGLDAIVTGGFSTIGGGSAPGTSLPTRLVAIAGHSASALEASLRRQQPPVVARIEQDRVLLDLRTVEPDQDETLTTAVLAACTP